MNLAAAAPGWAVTVLLVLLALAAVEDAVRLRISNLISIAVLVLAFVVVALVGPEAALWRNLVVFAATLLVGTMLFSRGALGGGDVKLLAATSLWFDFDGAIRFVVCVAMAGGLLALLVLLIRQVSWSDGARQRVVVLRRRGGIPYGVAIAAGAAAAIWMLHAPEQRNSRPLQNWELPAPQR